MIEQHTGGQQINWRSTSEKRALNKVLLSDLKACSKTRDLKRGKRIHEKAVASGHDSNIYLSSALINMYARCGSMDAALHVFDSMKHPDVVAWNALILGYAENGQGLVAIDLFNKMKCGGHAPNSVTIVAALKACTSLAVKGGTIAWKECKQRGNEIYNFALNNGCDSDIKVQNTLIDMYANCGSIVDARHVFDNMKQPTVVSWNALILGYAENGQGITALDLFMRMRSAGLALSSVTFLAALKACTSLAVKEGASKSRNRGKEIHDFAIENGCDSDIKVENSLIDMYAKCGSMIDARHVFDNIKYPNLVSWNTLILGYAENGQGMDALDLLVRMMKDGGHAPNSVTMLAALRACTSLALEGGPSGQVECKHRGREIQILAVKHGCHSDIYVQNTLIYMYTKCGSMVDAQDVFDTMKPPNVVSWTVLILGYAENGQALAALDLFTRMKSEGPAPNSVTFAAALKVCALLGALEFGRAIHLEVDDLNVILVNCLVDFYVKCGSLVDAHSVFDHAKTRDLITWNALLTGYSNCGNNELVFRLFEGMQDAGFLPDSVTFVCMLTCCSHEGLVETGQVCFETMSSQYGISPSIKHYNCMVDMFGRANKLDDAMALLHFMPCSPNDVTWTAILDASRTWKNLELGRLAFQSLIHFIGTDAIAYVLMGQIYGSKGMLQEQEMVMRMRLKACI